VGGHDVVAGAARDADATVAVPVDDGPMRMSPEVKPSPSTDTVL
jgi:hypothetical protein